MGAAYTRKLKGKRDKHADGYYYIDTGNVLEPGTLYEMSVYQRKPHRNIKRIDVTTGMMMIIAISTLCYQQAVHPRMHYVISAVSCSAVLLVYIVQST